MANLVSGWTIKSIEDGVEEGDLTEEFACINPASLRKQLGGAAKISSVFVDRANSYYCPWGYPYGQAWLLIDGKTLRQLKMNKRQAVRCYISEADASGSPADVPSNRRSQNRELTFNSLYIQRAICVAGGPTKGSYDTRNLIKPFQENRNDKDVYLLELVDIRYLWKKFTSLNKGYNVLCHATSTMLSGAEEPTLVLDDAADKEKFFYQQTLVDDESSYYLYSWRAVVTNILEEIGESLLHREATFSSVGDVDTTIPDTGEGAYPVSLEYYGWNCWDALTDLTRLRGAYPAFNPVDGEIVFCSMNEAFYDSSQDLFLEKPEIIDYIHSQQLFDYRSYENPCLMFPEKLRNITVFSSLLPVANPCWESATDDPRRTSWPNRYMGTNQEGVDTGAESESSGYNFATWAQVSLDPIPGTVERFIDAYPFPYLGSALADKDTGEGDFGDYSTHPDSSPLLQSTNTGQNHGAIFPDNSNPAYSERQNTGFFGKRIYQGLAHFYRDSSSGSLTYLTPNHQTGNIVWRDYGDGLGLVTEAFVNPTPNTFVGQRTSAAEELVQTSSRFGNSIQPRVAGFHSWPSDEASAPPQRRHELYPKQHPDTAFVMMCKGFPPSETLLGTPITEDPEEDEENPGKRNAIVVYPYINEDEKLSWHNSSLNRDNTTAYGPNFGPQCYVVFDDMVQATNLVDTDYFSTSGAGICYPELGSINDGFPGPIWHGRIFQGTYVGASSNGVPTFLVTSNDPKHVRRFELDGDLSAGSTATAKLRQANDGTLTTEDETFEVWSEFIEGESGDKGYAVFMRDMLRWEVIQLEC